MLQGAVLPKENGGGTQNESSADNEVDRLLLLGTDGDGIGVPGNRIGHDCGGQ